MRSQLLISWVTSSLLELTLDTIDMGLALDAVEFQRRFVTRAFLPSDTMDGRTALINTWLTLSCISVPPTMIQADLQLMGFGCRLTAGRSRPWFPVQN